MDSANEQVQQYAYRANHKRKEKTGQQYPMFYAVFDSIFLNPDARQ